MGALFVLAILFLLVGPVLAIVALVKTSTLETKIRNLKAEIANLTAMQVAAPIAPIPQPIEVAAKAATKKVETREEQAPESDQPPLPPELPVTPPPPFELPPARNMEQALASRWLVWLGGAAIAIGGLLFIKYAHDNGLIPPIMRVIIGWVAAAALVFAAEWLRRKRGEAVKDYVPAALSAAGLVIAFGSSYAAYALYNIFAPAVCFPILAAISLAALWLATRQGPLIAALGLIGATVTPALVSTNNPSTSGFFAYLLVIVVASLWLLRTLNWWWLGYAAVTVGLGWSLLWINGFGLNPSLPIGIFGLAIGAAATLVPRGKAILDDSMGNLLDSKSITPPMGVAIAGCIAGSIILAALTIATGHATLSLLMFAIGMAAIVAFGWLRQGFVAAPLLAAVATLLVLMAWHDVGFHTWAFDEQGFWTTVPGLFEPPRFRDAMLNAMLAFTAIGLFGVLRKTDQRPWAALAAGSSFLFLFGAWSRADFTMSWQLWSVLAVSLAAGLASVVLRKRDTLSEPMTARSIEFLCGSIALLGCFAIDRTLDGVWQTMVTAAFAAAFAYATRTIALPHVAGIASAVASFAALRLFYGREFWGEPRDLPLGGYWVVYGYGIPAVLFWQASKWLHRDGFLRWRVAFEGISLGLAVALVSLVLRVWIGGGIVKDELGLLELAAHGCAWLGAAYGLAYRQQLYSTFVSVWGARILLAASCLAFAGALIGKNPVFTGDAVAGGQVFNALWLAYLAPVPLLALIARKLDGLGWSQLRSAIGGFALVLLMAFVTLLVKRQFQGAVLDIEFQSQAESYAVSLAWLVTGIGIFIAGLKLDRQTIRYGGLAVIVLTVLKVFGYDLFSLGGLWRIASVIGLGLCLVGVGWLYTRFISNKSTVSDTPPVI
jgi:uncharacterized membrane protein